MNDAQREMTLRRKLLRIGYWLTKGTGWLKPGYMIERNGMIIYGSCEDQYFTLSLDEAIEDTKTIYRSQGLEYGEEVEPERPLTDEEEEAIEKWVMDAEEINFHQADYSLEAELEQMENYTKRAATQKRKFWERWEKEMNKNAKQNAIASCLEGGRSR